MVMNLSKKAKLIIYRFREKGLEIFLVNPDESGEQWIIPESEVDGDKSRLLMEEERLIELDPVTPESGNPEEAVAMEGDWHEIPSLKGMLFEDAQALKNKLKEMDQGTFFDVKEAFKKVLPHQYNFLKELKDILVDRNSVKDI
jgi:predicted NUDIX family NTP pyrophosphohydrolase